MRSGAAVADVHVAAGHATAPCGIGARSTSRRALGRGLLRAQQHSRLRGAPARAAAQRGAEAGAAGACVAAAPVGVPRGRRAKKNAAKVASKGTPLPGGALWA